MTSNQSRFDISFMVPPAKTDLAVGRVDFEKDERIGRHWIESHQWSNLRLGVQDIGQIDGRAEAIHLCWTVIDPTPCFFRKRRPNWFYDLP